MAAETTKTAASKATKQATHATKNAAKAAELAPTEVVRAIDARSLGIGIVGATLGVFAVQQGRALLAKRRLQKEIDKATAENPGHRGSVA